MPTKGFPEPIIEREVATVRGRIVTKVSAVAGIPSVVITGQTILATWGNAVRSTLLKTIAGLVTAQGQFFYAHADDDVQALNAPSGTDRHFLSIATLVPTWRALIAANIPDLPASKIISGVFNAARIPSLAASKITSGAFNVARIPSLAASKITSGAFNVARIPNLNANKINAGTFGTARIPTLPIGSQTSGNLPGSRVNGAVANATLATNAQNVDGKSLWTGTEAEYDAITSPDANTIYVQSL